MTHKALHDLFSDCFSEVDSFHSLTKLQKHGFIGLPETCFHPKHLSLSEDPSLKFLHCLVPHFIQFDLKFYHESLCPMFKRS